jgi:hypothetical protein
MADKKKAAEGGAVSEKKANKGAGKKAAAPEAAVPEVAAPEAAVVAAPRTKSIKIPKLASKNKSRLPRREKKARQKAADAAQSRG